MHVLCNFAVAKWDVKWIIVNWMNANLCEINAFDSHGSSKAIKFDKNCRNEVMLMVKEDDCTYGHLVETDGENCKGTVTSL